MEGKSESNKFYGVAVRVSYSSNRIRPKSNLIMKCNIHFVTNIVRSHSVTL